ncbi:Ca2+ regulator and membrane fusion protein Fig1-domain-containing protein [Chaetomium strumarium]|uniref:Ca2+ regulator and membrane fusion protein Fig1-domain-containing protein n=1 Tax=Chaetomium strumarium TaxID=1170767 RepID=A0AAJ0GZY0_9PEZI|nr:Ca2+ regulator and membrane fusion protein Fig1-domain-containing protein [Chaetomium strumarium]
MVFSQLKSYIPFRYIGFHHGLELLLVISIILLSILLVGCTTESMKDIYLLSLSYTGTEPTTTDTTIITANVSSCMTLAAASKTLLTVRVGYFGYCIVDNGVTSCSSDAGSLATLLRQTNSSDPLNMLYMVKSFHDQTIFSALPYLTRPGTASDSDSEREVKPFPWKAVSWLAWFMTLVATLFSLVAALWQHLSSAATATMVNTLTYGTVSGTVGAGAMAFAWIATGVLFIAVIGLLLMIMSMLAFELFYDAR